MKKILLLIILTTLSLSNYASISESEADRVIERFKTIFSSPFLEATFKDLVFVKDFRKFEKRAYIEEKSLFFRVTIERGLIDARETTSDSFALILCHELGHAMGGAPYKKSKTMDQFGETITTVSWSSAEGQADYYATSSCMKKYLEEEDNGDFLQNADIPDSLIDRCSQNTQDPLGQAICIRSALAIIPALTIINPNKDSLSFSTPDQNLSDSTLLGYPTLQCRMDTYLHGATGEEKPRCWYLPGHDGNASWKF